MLTWLRSLLRCSTLRKVKGNTPQLFRPTPALYRAGTPSIEPFRLSCGNTIYLRCFERVNNKDAKPGRESVPLLPEDKMSPAFVPFRQLRVPSGFPNSGRQENLHNIVLSAGLTVTFLL